MITRLIVALGSMINLNEVPIVNGGEWSMALEYSLVDIIALAVGAIALVTVGIFTIRGIAKAIARRKNKTLARAKERVLAKENEKSKEKQDSKKMNKAKATLQELSDKNNAISNNKFHGSMEVKGGDIKYSLANQEVYSLVTEFAKQDKNKNGQAFSRLDVDYPEYSTHKDEFVVAPKQFLKNGVLYKYIYENAISDKVDYPISYTLTDQNGNKETFRFNDASKASEYVLAKLSNASKEVLQVLDIDLAKLEQNQKVDYAQLKPNAVKAQDMETEGK